MPDLFAFSPITFSVKKIFLFKIYKGLYKTKITMLCAETVSTSQVPDVYDKLIKLLPTVFKSKCYNEQNYPFSKEVKRTEIAHLFEHIMLEYICQYKLARGENRVSVSGVTDWNWRRDPFGMFHITIQVGRSESDVLASAFKKSCDLLDLLIDQSVQYEKQTV
jgi:hypothetical protein